MELTFQSSLLTFLILLLFLKLFKNYKGSNRDRATPKLPPGPWKLPLIGSIHHLATGSLPHRSLRDLALKHGPIMHLQLGEISAVVISNAQMAKEVLKTHDIAFATRPKLLAAEIITYNYKDVGWAPYGEYWKQMRKICVLEVLSAKKIRAFCSIREEEVWSMIGSIHTSSASSPINLSQKVFALTNSVSCRAAFGNRCKDQDLLVKLINETVAIASGFNISDMFPSKKFLHFLSGSLPKIMKLHRQFDKILENMVQEHREKLLNTEEQEEDDLVDSLLKIKENGGLDFPITNESIKAIIVDMFTAGTETTAVLVLWAMSEMIRNPRVLKDAQAEVRWILRGKSKVYEKDLQGLNYIKMVIKETLRLHPPVAMLVPRECREEREINGYKIPVKTKIIINAWAIHRDPEHWGDAEVFKPERFAKSSIETIGPNFEYIPFGGGRRICPGILFGSATAELALVQLLYHFDWKVHAGMEPESLDMTEAFGATVNRKNDVCLVASPVFSTI